VVVGKPTAQESVGCHEKKGTDEDSAEAGSSDTIYLCACQAD
jgi:hypothetical protein